MLTGTHHTQTASHQCEYACDASYRYAGCKCMSTPHTKMDSHQCVSACDASKRQLLCKCVNTQRTRKASRQYVCACDASGCQLWCTRTHTHHKQTVAHQCASSHDRHNLISDCSYTCMPSSSTYARPPRVQCEEGRKQTRAQRHLHGNKNECIHQARIYFLYTHAYASKRLPCPGSRVSDISTNSYPHVLHCTHASVSRPSRARLWSIVSINSICTMMCSGKVLISTNLEPRGFLFLERPRFFAHTIV